MKMHLILGGWVGLLVIPMVACGSDPGGGSGSGSSDCGMCDNSCQGNTECVDGMCE